MTLAISFPIQSKNSKFSFLIFVYIKGVFKGYLHTQNTYQIHELSTIYAEETFQHRSSFNTRSRGQINCKRLIYTYLRIIKFYLAVWNRALGLHQILVLSNPHSPKSFVKSPMTLIFHMLPIYLVLDSYPSITNPRPIQTHTKPRILLNRQDLSL